MLIQLDPPIPVIVTSKNNAKGQALFLHDWATEQNPEWVVAIDETCEIWWIPNPEIRIQKNWTLGRR